MAIGNRIRDKKLQYGINGESAKISSGKNDKHEYLKGENILPSDQRRVIEKAKFTSSSLGKAFVKQIKTIENWGIKQVKPLKALGVRGKSTTPKINWISFSKANEN